VFDAYVGRRLRLGAPLVKLRAARLGITAASDAIEMHGGNGYTEHWPVARILRDAQVNTVWEGPDNILCLDVRRAIVRESAHLAFLERLRGAVARAPSGDEPTVTLVRERLGDLVDAVDRWGRLEARVAEARLYPLAQLMVDVYSAALLVEQAGLERERTPSGRKGLVARLYARWHLGETGRLRGIEAPAEELERFDELAEGAFVDGRLQPLAV